MNKKKKKIKRPDDNEFKRMSQKWRQWNILFRQRTKVNGLSEDVSPSVGGSSRWRRGSMN